MMVIFKRKNCLKENDVMWIIMDVWHDFAWPSQSEYLDERISNETVLRDCIRFKRERERDRRTDLERTRAARPVIWSNNDTEQSKWSQKNARHILTVFFFVRRSYDREKKSQVLPDASTKKKDFRSWCRIVATKRNHHLIWNRDFGRQSNHFFFFFFWSACLL